AVDLAALTADLASVFRSAIERAGLAFEVHCEPIEDPVYIDQDMWEKVIFNLLSNALKFTFTGAISVRACREASEAVVTVADTGTGVPAAEMSRLFERFHRIENARGRSNEGSGIGLALVKELIQLHGGTITADSAEGQGTTFTIRLPVGAAHLPSDVIAPADGNRRANGGADAYVEEALRWLPPGHEEPDASGQEKYSLPNLSVTGPTAASGTGALRVLIADDNADMRDYLGRLLRSDGYQVETVADGYEA
ncbi:histidine kinase, partial [Mycobacterium sp. ITM-2017-0098]